MSSRGFVQDGWDIIAIVLLLVAAILVFRPVTTRAVEDFWYHLAAGRAVAEHGLSIWDTWSFQPAGRPQLYPPLLHLILGGLIRLSGNALQAALVLRGLLWESTLVITWVVARSIRGPRAAVLVLAIVSADLIGFLAAMSLMPAALVAALLPLLVWAILRQRWILGGIILGAAFLTHPGLPWAVALGLLLASFFLGAWRRTIHRAVGLGLLIALPWIIHVLAHLGAIDWARLWGGFSGEARAFGYASHWELPLLAHAVWWWALMRNVARRRVALVLSMLLALTLASATTAPLAGDAEPIFAALAALTGIALGTWIIVEITRTIARHRAASSTIDALRTVLLALLIGLLPVALLYGGRITWHIGPLLALLVLCVPPTRTLRPSRARAGVITVLVLVCATVLPALLFSSRYADERRVSTAISPLAQGVLNAPYALKPEQEALVAWVAANVPMDEILHTDDPGVGSLIPALTGRRTDNGLLWEVQPDSGGQMAIAAARERARGAFVFVGPLPNDAAPRLGIGGWSVVWTPW